VYVALEHARTLSADKTVIALLPDWGGKYISKMFNDEWMRSQGML
jgi:cystathionine beta-synthase